MESFLGPNLWTIVILTALMSSVVALLFYWLSNVKSRRYDEKERRTQLERLRAYFESKINKLTQRMVITEERWRDVNHLVMSAMERAPDVAGRTEKTVRTQFLESFGIGDTDLKIETDLVFVLTAFHSDFQETFNTVVDVCRNLGLRCLRGDEQNVRGDLLKHILRLLVKARIVIANIDGRNPNVFYELGIAQAIDKSTILISSSVSKMPFDVRMRKIVIWKTSEELRDSLKTELARAMAGRM